jgi:molybdopterin-binding protein
LAGENKYIPLYAVRADEHFKSVNQIILIYLIMELRASNKIKGKITDIKPGFVMAKISIEITGGISMSSVFTADRAEDQPLI